jgi:hypothetical protein
MGSMTEKLVALLPYLQLSRMTHWPATTDGFVAGLPNGIFAYRKFKIRYIL